MRRIAFAVALAGLTGLAAAGAAPPLGNETINYSYDARGRLTNVTHSGTVNNNVVTNYTYDKADNRVTVNVTGAP
jgi:YD repeat-containing protein